jgi:glucan phosphoethanolaminetransferase (alkaline phosphatase superfamily)
VRAFDTRQRAAAGLFGEALLIAAPAAAFLVLYVSRFGRPATAVPLHALILVVAWLAAASLRMAAHRWLPHAVARAAGAITLGAGTSAALLYYALVIGGIASWGHVISWELFVSYCEQAEGLADALMLSLPAILASLAAMLLGLVGAAWAWLGRFDWTAAMTARDPRHAVVLSTAGLALAGLCAFQFSFVSSDWARAGEPVSLTISPRASSIVLQSNRMSRSDHHDAASAAEDAARASLKPASAARRRNVVVIVVDALRPDHMGVYGYHRDTTPWLSRVAGDGRLQRYDGLRSVCSESACGLLGLFASRYVHELPARPITLHQVLKTNGYRVEAILGGDHTRFYGLDSLYRGIDRYRDGGDPVARAEAGGIRYQNDDTFVLRTVEALPKWAGTPTMLQLHLMSAHLLGNRITPQAPFSPARPYRVTDSEPSPSATNWYDNGVVQTDDMIRKLLEALSSRGYLDDAIVLITADHGEALGEHGHFTHAHGLHEPVIKIPLLLMTYGAPMARPLHARGAASQIDIAPTLLEELGVPAPPTWTGVTLTAPGPAEPIRFQQGSEIGLIDARDPSALLKYWVDSRTGVERAYDLSVDPQERNDLANRLAPERRREYRLDVMRRTPVSLVRKHGDFEF